MNYVVSPRSHCFYMFDAVGWNNVGVFVYKINACHNFHVHGSMATALAIIMADFVGFDFTIITKSIHTYLKLAPPNIMM